MPLELRPNCECCDCDLPPESREAMICTFECTFCSQCAERMNHVCPNCGGELVRRPIRPTGKLVKNPASTVRVHHDGQCFRPCGAEENSGVESRRAGTPKTLRAR